MNDFGIPMRTFYAVLTVRNTVMAFPWHPLEIADAMTSRHCIKLLRSFDAFDDDAAENEARRLFAAGQGELTFLGIANTLSKAKGGVL